VLYSRFLEIDYITNYVQAFMSRLKTFRSKSRKKGGQRGRFAQLVGRKFDF
jgi:hypothetical protein